MKGFPPKCIIYKKRKIITGPGNVLFCRLVRTFFSSEILQAVVVKG